MSDDLTSYSPMHTKDTELVPLTHQQTEEYNYSCENFLNWGVTPCDPWDKEAWKIPFAVGKSRYLSYINKSSTNTQQDQVYDIPASLSNYIIL